MRKKLTIPVPTETETAHLPLVATTYFLPQRILFIPVNDPEIILLANVLVLRSFLIRHFL